MTSPDPKNPEVVETLYQLYSFEKSRLPRSWRSKTESVESFHIDAIRECMRLKLNGTIPNHIVHLNYLIELPKRAIQDIWRKNARRLRNKIVGRAAMEITKDEWRQRPVNRIHYHIVVKDHNRTHDKLRKLFENVWRKEMDESAYKVTVIPFDDNKEGGWEGYIGYFVKVRDPDGENVLFKRGLRLRRYYDIGQWWTNKDGTPSSIGAIDAQIQRYADTRRRHKEAEKFISLNPRFAEWEKPTDPNKLKEVLDRETDETLYDWFSIMLGQPTVFHTNPPRWLVENMTRQPLKGYDLLDAIYERIKDSNNSDIIIALEIYHEL